MIALVEDMKAAREAATSMFAVQLLKEDIARLERLLWDWAANYTEPPKPAYDRVFLRELGAADLVVTAFEDISRDGAAFGDVLDATASAL